MSRKRVKQYLQLLIAVGVVAIALGSGGGTFASFNAETANPGNTFATGTLYLHDSVNGATACTSESTSTNQNVPAVVGGSNPGDTCGVLFNFPATQKYNQPFTVHLALSDAGTLAGSGLKFQLNGAGCIYNDIGDVGSSLQYLDGTETANGSGLTAGLTSGNPVTSLSVGALARRIPASSQITLDAGGGHTQTFVTSGNTAASATTINVVAGQNANFSYPSGTTAVNTITNVTTIALNTATTVGVASGAAIQIGTGTLGGNDTFTSAGVAAVGSTSLSVNSVPLASLSSHAYAQTDEVYAAFGANNACSQIPYTITETNSTYNGDSQAHNAAVANGSGLSSSLVNTTHYTTLSVGALGRAIEAGTQITIGTPAGGPYTHQQTVTVAANAAASATSLTVNDFAANFSYPSGNTDVLSTYGTQDLVSTLANQGGTTIGYEGCAYGTAANGGCVFDGLNNIAGIPTRQSSTFNTLTLSSGGGTGSTSGHNSGTGLDASGGTRYFIITVYPNFGDPVMGETATFDLVWHLDQA